MEEDKKRRPWWRKRRVWSALVVLLGVLGAVWVCVEPTLIRVEHHRLALERWPQSHPELSIALLGDTHTGAPLNGLTRLEAIVDKTNEAAPDVVVLAGDYVYHGAGADLALSPEAIGAVLGKLKAPLGVYAVLGNHDWWEDGPRVRKALEDAGIETLEDKAVRLTHKGQPLWLVGASDLWESRCDIRGAMAQVSDDAPVLLVTHNPDAIQNVPARVALTMAGHTHGGQVWLPFVGTPVLPINGDFAQGYFEEGQGSDTTKALFVTPGLGTTGLPVRFMVPPEISMLDIRSP